MVVFSNPGLIDLEAVKTLGVSVKAEGAFGRFGTGLKFAIATILRGGGLISIMRGQEEHTFGTVERIIRDKPFQIVTLDGETLGITTQLGKDWEPWMVLRELGCNALDEGGAFQRMAPEVLPGACGPDRTTVVVQWEALDAAYDLRREVFLEGESIWENGNIRILPGPGAHFFHRGIRVFKLDKPSLFTYDLISFMSLTEDRTLYGAFQGDNLIRDTFLAMDNRDLASKVLTCDDSFREHRYDFNEPSYGVKPSPAFLDATAEARESKKLGNDSARRVLSKHQLNQEEQRQITYKDRAWDDDRLVRILELLRENGIEFTDDQAFISVEELPGPEMLSMVQNGRVFLRRDMLAKPGHDIATELIRRWVDLNIKGFTPDDAVLLLAPLFVRYALDLKPEAIVLEELELHHTMSHVLEGTWDGYRASQTAVKHRELVDEETAGKLNDAVIHFTDGTSLTLTTRPLGRFEQVELIDSYGKLIRECLRRDIWSVAGIEEARKADAASITITEDIPF